MQEVDKCDIEITTDRHINSGSKRFEFCPRQSQLCLFLLILLAIGILAFTIIPIILYHPLANISESELKFLPRNGYDNDTQIALENNENGPCDNFYNFACQAWQKDNPKPERQYKWTVFAVQYYKINKLVIDILEKPIQDIELDAIKQAKNLYNKCLTDNITLQSVKSGIIGQTGYPAIKELCKDSVKNIFNIALGHQIAVLKYGDIDHLENIRTDVKQMFENMKNWFNHMDTRSLSNSIDQTKLCVGLPDWIFNRTRVQAEYTELKLDAKQAYRHQMDAANHWLRNLNSEKKSNYNSECPWNDSMGYESAYYLRSKNLIYLPLGLLEPPYFSQKQSEDQNYGCLGTIIGHELAHAYLVANADSIQNSTLTCLQSQYNSFTGHQQQSQNLSLRLDPTIHENLADNLGLTASYNARFRSGPVRDAQKENNHTWNVQKPNGQFTDEQLFFLSFAQKYCESADNKVMRLEEHSPGMSRVLGALQNSNQFAKAWNCPTGSIMNPSPSEHQKCQFGKK